mmetsp:Transcript_66722/g.124659  ORF Transcript_66722/g.124659 Transcript_66722/m.124659 type:complete len:398 (-) Transcript_66722:86-1279(-)
MAGKLIALADSHLEKGRLREAERIITQAANKTVGDQELEPLALTTKARILLAAGKAESAAEAAVRAIDLYRSASKSSGLADAQLTYADVMLARKQQEKAKELALDSIAIHRQAGDKGKMSKAKTKLASIICAGGFRADFREAAVVAQEAVDIGHEAGDKQAEAGALATLAKANASAGKFTESASFANDAMSLYKELGEKRQQARVMVELAEAQLLLAVGEDSTINGQTVSDAMQLLADARDVYQELGDKAGQAYALQVIAKGHVSMSQAKTSHSEAREAEKVARQSQTLYWALNDKSGVARNWLTIAQVRYITNDVEDAVQTTTVAQKLFKEEGNTLGVAEAGQILELAKHAAAAAGAEGGGDGKTSQSVDYLMTTKTKAIHAHFDKFQSRLAKRVS